MHYVPLLRDNRSPSSAILVIIINTGIFGISQKSSKSGEDQKPSLFNTSVEDLPLPIVLESESYPMRVIHKKRIQVSGLVA